MFGIARTQSQGLQDRFSEQVEGSVSYQDHEPAGPVCLVVGNEVEGVSEDLLSLCDRTIEIEMAGLKNSLNVAVAFGVVAYHFRNCLKNKIKTP